MTEITAALVKELREKSGAGMMDCKRALKESGGNVENAMEHLRKNGLKDIGKRSGKVAAEGAIGSYLHAGDQVGVMVELNCETDFVARGDDFKETARQIAMHVAAMSPTYTSKDDVPQTLLNKEEEIILETLNEKQKEMADKIIPGKLEKFYSENCLLNQIFVKDESGKKTIDEVVQDLSAKVGEKVTLRRFVRFQVGEGIEKTKANLAEEVEAAITGS